MSKSLYAYLVAFAAAMGGLLFGYEIGVIAQTLTMDSFGLFLGILYMEEDEYGLFMVNSADSRSLTGSVAFLFLLGCAIGAIFVSWLADVWGRKKSIVMAGMVFLIGGMLQSTSSERSMFFAGRVIGGFSIGILSMCAPLYISEASPSEERGRMVTIQQLMITSGVLIASCVNAVIIKTIQGDLEWRLALGLQCVPAFILVCCTMFMPESPRWLAGKDRNGECLTVLSRLRALPISHAAIQEEYQEIVDGVLFERSIGDGSWSEVIAPGILGRTVRVMMIQLFQQWSGINVILYYQGSLLIGMGLDKEAATIPFTIANNFINAVATFPGMYFIERIGRRKLLLMGGIGIGISHCLVCIFIRMGDSGIRSCYYLAIGSVYLFIFSYASTWGPIAWVYQSEVFPLRVRSKGTGMATLSNWSNNALISFLTPLYFEPMGANMYLIFSALGFVMACFVYFFVPETMGKTLEEMDEVFGHVEGGSKENRLEFERAQQRNKN